MVCIGVRQIQKNIVSSGFLKSMDIQVSAKTLKTMNYEIKYGSNESQCSEFSHYTAGRGISLGIFRL